MYGNLREVKQEAEQPFILHHVQHCLGVVDCSGWKVVSPVAPLMVLSSAKDLRVSVRTAREKLPPASYKHT